MDEHTYENIRRLFRIGFLFDISINQLRNGNTSVARKIIKMVEDGITYQKLFWEEGRIGPPDKVLDCLKVYDIYVKFCREESYDHEKFLEELKDACKGKNYSNLQKFLKYGSIETLTTTYRELKRISIF